MSGDPPAGPSGNPDWAAFAEASDVTPELTGGVKRPGEGQRAAGNDDSDRAPVSPRRPGCMPRARGEERVGPGCLGRKAVGAASVLLPPPPLSVGPGPRGGDGGDGRTGGSACSTARVSEDVSADEEDDEMLRAACCRNCCWRSCCCMSAGASGGRDESNSDESGERGENPKGGGCRGGKGVPLPVAAAVATAAGTTADVAAVRPEDGDEDADEGVE